MALLGLEKNWLNRLGVVEALAVESRQVLEIMVVKRSYRLKLISLLRVAPDLGAV